MFVVTVSNLMTISWDDLIKVVDIDVDYIIISMILLEDDAVSVKKSDPRTPPS